MGKGFKMLISCDKATHTCDKTQYDEASLWEKIKLNIHLLICKACRKYSSNNGKLTKLIHKSDVECLNATEKERLKVNLNNELKNNQ
jgi:predicted anti-sigma-YlaC factor YlaD